MSNDTTPQLYCGTYYKYNCGSIQGKWLKLDDYADAEDFLKACYELHKNEDDPEFMFQDFEGFPRELYNESMGKNEIQAIYDWMELDEHDKALLAAYLEGVDSEGDIEQARWAFRASGDSEKTLVQQYYEDTGSMEGLSDFWINHINWDSVVYELKCSGWTFVRYEGTTYAFS